MNNIELWLLKYSDEYKKIDDYVQSQHWTELDGGTPVRIPLFWKNSADDTFLALYGALDSLSEFHRKEEYFKQEISTYHKIKHSRANLKNWTLKNESLGADQYVYFTILPICRTA